MSENTRGENISSQEESSIDQDQKIRPRFLQEFIGQTQIKSNLQVFIDAAKERSESLDHTLFYGPPGLGKTTLSQVIASEMGVNIKTTSGPIINKAADLAAILTNLQEYDVLFIDEIHRLSKNIEEVLYSAMEDFVLDVMIGEGPSARSIRINLPNFTLIGATTRLGLLSNPLRDRFGIPLKLNFYSVEELSSIITRAGKLFNIKIQGEATTDIAMRSRGTPRIALRLLKRIRDFAIVLSSNVIDIKIVNESLAKLEIDKIGLDDNDYRYLRCIMDNYNGGPVGVNTISIALSEQRDTIEETVEPYLIQLGFLQRTSRGRILTNKAFKHLGLNPPVDRILNQSDQDNLECI
ncbi:MAG: Holliday junction branch migration DNA helicase RuvB [Rickettsiaceae bacterium]